MNGTGPADGVTLLRDPAPAVPASIRAGLKRLAELARERGGRSFAVVGPVTDVGPDGAQDYDAVGRLAVRLSVSRLVAVGETARPIWHGAALEGSWDGEAGWVPDVEAAIAVVRAEARPGDVVLLMASRAASLDDGPPAVAEDADAGPERGGDGA